MFYIILDLKSVTDMPSAASIFSGPRADLAVKEVKSWLNEKGIRDLEAVSLYCDQLDKVCFLSKLFFSLLLTKK